MILPSRYMDALVSDMPAIAGIVDLKTGEPVGFDSAGLGPWSDYAYDPVGGNLIQQAENHFVVQRRGESGDFEVVYTISPSHLNMMLHSAGHACDGQWLVLQNEEVCEIYRLEDGVLCYTIRKPDHRISQMAVIDGKLYDFSVGWDRVCIPLPDINEARIYVRSVLTYEHGRRTLTDQEMAEYYIPSHWQEK